MLSLIIWTATATTLAERYQEQVGQLNLFLHPILNTEALSELEPGPGGLMETLINQVLMNKDAQRTFLWVDLVKGSTQYEFFFDRSWDPQSKDEGAVQRKAGRIFKSYIELGSDQARCQRVSSSDMREFEKHFRNKMVNFVAGMVEFRQKSLLYQLLPNGKYDRAGPTSFKYVNDIQTSTAIMLAEVAPFIRCLQAHTQIKVADGEHDGFFLRFWNWLRGLFGLKPKKVIAEESDLEVKSEVKGQLLPDGSQLSELTFATKEDEFQAFADKLSAQGAVNLDNYRSNIEQLSRFMRDPGPQFTHVLSALLLKFRAEGDLDAEKWKYAATPVFLYNMMLNCEDADGQCRQRLLEGYRSQFEAQTQIFADSFGDLEDVSLAERPAHQQFVLKCFGIFLGHLLSIDQALATDSLKSFWAKYTVSTRRPTQTNNLAVARGLEALIIASPLTMENHRLYGLAFEILTYLPAGESLASKEWIESFVGMFAELSIFFGLDALRIGGDSKVLIGQPVGSIAVIPEYYEALSGLLVDFLKKTPEPSKAVRDFPRQFDAFLDDAFKAGNALATQNYPVLKLHNLWAANEVSLLPKAQLLESDATQKTAWSQRFLQPQEQAPFVGFLRSLVAAGQEGNAASNDELWGLLGGRLEWTAVQDLAPSVSRLLNLDAQREEAHKSVQLI